MAANSQNLVLELAYLSARLLVTFEEGILPAERLKTAFNFVRQGKTFKTTTKTTRGFGGFF